MSAPSTPPMRPSSPSWISFSPDIISPSPSSSKLSGPSTPSKYSRPVPPPTYNVTIPSSIPKIGAPPQSRGKGRRRAQTSPLEDDASKTTEPGQDLDSLIYATAPLALLPSPIDPFTSASLSPTASDAPSMLSPSTSSESRSPLTPIDFASPFSPPLQKTFEDDNDTLEILSADPLVAHFSSSLTLDKDPSDWDDFYSSLATAVPINGHFPLTPKARNSNATSTRSPSTPKHPYGYSSYYSSGARSRRGSAISVKSYSRRGSINVIMLPYSSTGVGSGNKTPRIISTPASPTLRRTKSFASPASPVTPRILSYKRSFRSPKMTKAQKKILKEKEKVRKEKERQRKRELDRMPIKDANGLEIDPIDWFFGIKAADSKAMRNGYHGFGVEGKGGWKKTEDFEGLLRKKDAEEEEETKEEESEKKEEEVLVIKKSNSFRHRPPPLDLSRSRSSSLSIPTSSSSTSNEFDFSTPPSSAKTIASTPSPFMLSPDPLTKEIRRRASEAALRPRREEGANSGGKTTLAQRLKEFWKAMQKEKEGTSSSL